MISLLHLLITLCIKWGKDSSRALCNVRNLYSTNSNYIFSDNIIAEPGSTTLPNIIVATGGTLSAENNLVVNYGSYNITSATSSSITDNSLETLGLTEIGFVNADGGDFTILSTSPIATASTNRGYNWRSTLVKTINKCSRANYIVV